ncbi:MAG TPA: hypothetical protein VND83_10125 [Acidimicrobiales bacterium]|nr:hypothetical protein [Acidimicrobiales bacterium]
MAGASTTRVIVASATLVLGALVLGAGVVATSTTPAGRTRRQ